MSYLLDGQYYSYILSISSVLQSGSDCENDWTEKKVIFLTDTEHESWNGKIYGWKSKSVTQRTREDRKKFSQKCERRGENEKRRRKERTEKQQTREDIIHTVCGGSNRQGSRKKRDFLPEIRIKLAKRGGMWRMLLLRRRRSREWQWHILVEECSDESGGDCRTNTRQPARWWHWRLSSLWHWVRP